MQANNSKTRNGALDVYKFGYCLLIAVFHLYKLAQAGELPKHLPLGSIGVEFFVLSAGIFFYAGFERVGGGGDLTAYPLQYIKKRFMRFFPFTTVGFLWAAGVNRIFIYTARGGELSFQRLFKWFSADIWEITLIKMNGMNNGVSFVNDAAWTISSMLIVEFFILCILVRSKKNFVTFICPMSIIMGYGIWRHLENGGPYDWMWVTAFGTFRVYLLMCCAYFCYELSKKIKEMRYTKAGRIVLTVAEFCGYLLTLYIAEFYTSRNCKWLATLIFVLVLAITISCKSYSCDIFRDSKMTRFLGELSLGVYLGHFPVGQLLVYFYPNPDEFLAQKWLYLACVLVAGYLVIVLAKLMIKGATVLNSGLRKILVEE